MDQIPFEKVHACGNDFLILSQDPDDALVAAMCARRHGLGADGIMVYSLDQDQAVRIKHYDPDGSETFCINGLRATLSCLHTQGKLPGDAGVTIHSGFKIRYQFAPHLILTSAAPSYQALSLSLPDGELKGYFAGGRSPHFVVLDQAFGSNDFCGHALHIRWHMRFSEGANVHAVWREEDHWRIRSYERGVEGQTLACGSGMLAAAQVLHGVHGLKTIRFVPDGGDHVDITCDGQNQQLWGPSVWVASGVWRC